MDECQRRGRRRLFRFRAPGESMARSYRSVGVAVMAVLVLAMPSLFAVSCAKAAKAKSMTIHGTLQRVDGQTLTVQTPKGPEMVMLSSTAQIRQAGRRRSGLRAIWDSAGGTRITRPLHVESNGQKTAQKCDPGCGRPRRWRLLKKVGVSVCVGHGGDRDDEHEEVVDRHVGCCNTTSQSILHWRGAAPGTPPFLLPVVWDVRSRVIRTSDHRTIGGRPGPSAMHRSPPGSGSCRSRACGSGRGRTAASTRSPIPPSASA